MMYAAGIDQRLISVRYVPLHVGSPSSAEAVFFFSTATDLFGSRVTPS
jgi:hypothetical protein